jgi:hypothetical protein
MTWRSTSGPFVVVRILGYSPGGRERVVLVNFFVFLFTFFVE